MKIKVRMKSFDAAHQLPTHFGKCQHLHGHTYQVDVELSGVINSNPDSNAYGMVEDFSLLKRLYNENVHAKLDHTFILGESIPAWFSQLPTESLNASEGWAGLKVAILPIPATTAEWMSLWIMAEMSTALAAAEGSRFARIESVSVWETPTSCAICTAEAFQNWKMTRKHG
jgi:6-pyruvoyltetrahydropterin/6-carboxytetrahydropterin synthase